MTKKSRFSALDRALRYLSYRPRSESEIRQHLGIDYTPELASKLKKLNLVNDNEFAKWYIESRSRSRPRSARLLSLELKRKGLEIKNLKLEISELELAKNALKKKPNLKSREQTIRFLHSRGFSWDTIETVLKK